MDIAVLPFLIPGQSGFELHRVVDFAEAEHHGACLP